MYNGLCIITFHKSYRIKKGEKPLQKKNANKKQSMISFANLLRKYLKKYKFIPISGNCNKILPQLRKKAFFQNEQLIPYFLVVFFHKKFTKLQKNKENLYFLPLKLKAIVQSLYNSFRRHFNKSLLYNKQLTQYTDFL